MSDLNTSLHAMQFEQLLLAFAFLISYPLSLSHYVGVRGRIVAVLASLVAAVGFASMTTPWLHGVMLLVFAILGMGVFIAAVWGLSAVLGVVRIDAQPGDEALAEEPQARDAEEPTLVFGRRVHVHAPWPAPARVRRPRGAIARRVLRASHAHEVSRVRL